MVQRRPKDPKKRLNAINKRMRRNPDILQYQLNYRKERAKYKLAIKTAKTNSWKNFCPETSANYGTIFKLLRKKYLKNTDLIHSILESSQQTDEYLQIEQQLMNHHFGTTNQDIYQFHAPHLTIEEFNQAKIKMRELKYCIQLQNNKKAPGHDNIDGRIIKNLMKYFPSLLLNLYNKCIHFSHFPTSWKKRARHILQEKE